MPTSSAKSSDRVTRSSRDPRQLYSERPPQYKHLSYYDYFSHIAKIKVQVAQKEIKKHEHDAKYYSKVVTSIHAKRIKDTAPEPSDQHSLEVSAAAATVAKPPPNEALGDALYGTRRPSRKELKATEVVEYLELDETTARKVAFGFSDSVPPKIAMAKVADINTILFRLMGDDDGFTKSMDSNKEDKLRKARIEAARLNSLDKHKGDISDSTFKLLVGCDVQGLSICETMTAHKSRTESGALGVEMASDQEVSSNRGQRPGVTF